VILPRADKITIRELAGDLTAEYAANGQRSAERLASGNPVRVKDFQSRVRLAECAFGSCGGPHSPKSTRLTFEAESYKSPNPGHLSLRSAGRGDPLAPTRLPLSRLP
jgi:hypothetical protein